jgi:hypothetical protein
VALAALFDSSSNPSADRTDQSPAFDREFPVLLTHRGVVVSGLGIFLVA